MRTVTLPAARRTLQLIIDPCSTSFATDPEVHLLHAQWPTVSNINIAQSLQHGSVASRHPLGSLRRPRRPVAKRLSRGALTKQVSGPWSGISTLHGAGPAIRFGLELTRREALQLTCACTDEPTFASQGLRTTAPPSHGTAAASGSICSS